MDPQAPSRTASLENALGAIRGIRGARVGLENGLAHIRVLALPEVPHRALIDSVQRLATEYLGMHVPGSQIEILSSGTSDSEFGRARRRKLSSITTRRDSETFSARVSLELEGDVLIGEKRGAAGGAGEWRSVGLAVIDGLADLLSTPIDLETAEVLEVGTAKLAVVSLSKGAETLVGSSVVRLDEHDAIARAVLDALNRLLTAQGDESPFVSRPSSGG
ncbi:MAG: hypothetical protein QOC87_1472 [Actinomycetota bacterium]|nr:hypothetical protein [Actinomycetota bacterium]